jgi:hypothetical protein
LEIIAEILAQVVIFILQILWEIVLQLVFEIVGELLIHASKEPFRRPKPLSPLVAAAGYAIYGAAAGGISIWLLPHHLIEQHWLRIANLAIAPIVAGGLMAAIGAWRRRRDLEVVRLESFFYGYFFALFMALVRFTWAG